jgi:two-component system, NarL family, invasion response regulator UvrY
MKRILIVDDHNVVRRGLRDILAEEFEQLETGDATDGEEARRLLQSQAWDLVLLDIGLPGRSGLSVLEEIKRAQPRLPVLVLSMHPEEAYAIQAFRLGACGYLTKQTAADELRLAVRKALAGGRYVTPSLAEQLAEIVGNDAPSEPHLLLSARELQVLRGVAAGTSQKGIAAELSLSEKTIATYRRRIAFKTGLHTNVELTRYALQRGLVT